MIRDVVDAELVLGIGDAVATLPAQVHYGGTGPDVQIGGIAVCINGAWVAAPLVTAVLGEVEALRQAVADHAAGRWEDSRAVARAE